MLSSTLSSLPGSGRLNCHNFPPILIPLYKNILDEADRWLSNQLHDVWVTWPEVGECSVKYHKESHLGDVTVVFIGYTIFQRGEEWI